MQDYITSAGQAVVAASQYNRIQTFKLGSSYNYTPGVSDTNIRGTQVYTGSVTEVAVISASLIKLSVIIPASAGPFTYGEIGFFLDNASLFALASFEAQMTKNVETTDTDGEAFRIDAYINVVSGNASLSTGTSRNKTATLLSHLDLPNPVESSNLYIIPNTLDTNESIIAFAQSTLWSFTGYVITQVATITAVGSLQFSVATGAGKFQAGRLIQFITGPNAGVVRRIVSATPVGPNTVVVYDAASLIAPAINDQVVVYERREAQAGISNPAVTNLEMSDNRITGLGAPTASTDSTNKAYVDAQIATRLATAGGTLTGNLAMSNHSITGVATPTGNDHAATKSYVDGLAAPQATLSEIQTGANVDKYVAPDLLVSALNAGSGPSTLQIAVKNAAVTGGFSDAQIAAAALAGGVQDAIDAAGGSGSASEANVTYVAPSGDTTGATDKAAIQAALDGSTGIVRLKRGSTYYLNHTSTQTFNSSQYRYCVLLRDNDWLDLNGATVRLASGQNSIMFMNEYSAVTQRTDITVQNGTLYFDRANNGSVPSGLTVGLMLVNVLRPVVRDIVVKEAHQYGVRFLLCDQGVFKGIRILGGNGDGGSFGVSTQQVTNSQIDELFARDCLGSAAGTVGNGFLFCTIGCQVGRVEQIECNAGLKIQDETTDSQFAQLINRGGGSGGIGTHGIKIGGEAGLITKRVQVGQVIAENLKGNGLVVVACDDVHIGSVMCKDNVQVTANGRDLRLSGRNVVIDHAVSINSAAQGVAITDDTAFTDYSTIHIGKLHVHNATGRAVQLANSAHWVTGDDWLITDDRGTTTDILNVTMSTHRGHVNRIRTNLPFSSTRKNLEFHVGAIDFTLGQVQASTNNGYDVVTGGSITLSAGTSTTVSGTDHLCRLDSGGSYYLQPVILIEPVDAAARALGNFNYVVGDNSTRGLTIRHATAAGTEKVRWQVLRWQMVFITA